LHNNYNAYKWSPVYSTINFTSLKCLWVSSSSSHGNNLSTITIIIIIINNKNIYIYINDFYLETIQFFSVYVCELLVLIIIAYFIIFE